MSELLWYGGSRNEQEVGNELKGASRADLIVAV
jgi:hypothetical protein